MRELGTSPWSELWLQARPDFKLLRIASSLGGGCVLDLTPQGSVTADAAVRSVLWDDFDARLLAYRALCFAVFVWCKCLSSKCFTPPLITCFHCKTPAHPLLPDIPVISLDSTYQYLWYRACFSLLPGDGHCKKPEMSTLNLHQLAFREHRTLQDE